MIGQIIQNFSFKSGLRAFEEEMDREIFLAIGDLTASCNFPSIHYSRGKIRENSRRKLPEKDMITPS